MVSDRQADLTLIIIWRGSRVMVRRWILKQACYDEDRVRDLRIPPAGHRRAGVYADNLVRNVVGMGHEVTVFTPAFHDRGDRLSQGPAKVVEVDVKDRMIVTMTPPLLKIGREISGKAGKKRFDVIHVNGAANFGLLDRKNGPPVVATVHHLAREDLSDGKLRFADRIRAFNSEVGFVIPWLVVRHPLV
jgi:hypothetical protein